MGRFEERFRIVTSDDDKNKVDISGGRATHTSRFDEFLKKASPKAADARSSFYSQLSKDTTEPYQTNYTDIKRAETQKATKGFSDRLQNAVDSYNRYYEGSKGVGSLKPLMNMADRKKADDELKSLKSEIDAYYKSNMHTADKDYYQYMLDKIDEINGRYISFDAKVVNDYDRIVHNKEYAEQKKQAEDYQKLIGMDTEAAQNEIDTLTEMLDKLEKADSSRPSVNEDYLNERANSTWDARARITAQRQIDNSNARNSAADDAIGMILDGTGYTSSGELRNAIYNKTLEMNTAKRLQEWQSLTDNAMNHIGFDFYSQKGMETVDSVKEQAKSGLAKLAIGAKDEDIVSLMLNEMTEDEWKVYAFYIGKGDPSTANEYLDTIRETLNYRQADKKFKEDFEGNTLKEIAYGLATGIKSAGEGIGNFVKSFGDDTYIPASVNQQLSSMIREDLYGEGGAGGFIARTAYDVNNTVGMMIPSITVSSVAGGLGASTALNSIVSSAVMAAPAAGNDYAEYINKGMNPSQARSMAYVQGAWEGLSEVALGGIENFGANQISKLAFKSATETAGKGLKRAFGKFIVDALQEGAEEVIQDYGSAIIESAWTGKYNAPEDVMYSFVLGALSAAMLNGASAGTGAIVNAADNVKLGNKLKEEGNLEYLKKAGSLFSADSVAYKLAGKVDENTGAYQIAKLLNSINANMSEQNISDITNALVEKGMSEADARTNAEWMARAVTGEQLTSEQQKALDANDVLSKVFNEVIIEPNSTLNQRLVAAAEANSTREERAVRQQLKDLAVRREALEAEDRPVTDETIKEISPNEIISAYNKQSGYNQETEDYVQSNYETYRQQNVSAEDYARANREAYRYGQVGYSDMANASFANILTEGQRREMYKQGRLASMRAVTAEENKINSVIANHDGARRTGKVHLSEAFNSLSEIQKGSIRVIARATADVYGTDVFFYKSHIDSKTGKRIVDEDLPGVKKGETAPNGLFDTKTGAIYIDLNAGANGEGTMLYTFAHESTHFIRQYSPSMFDELTKAVVELRENTDFSLDETIKRYQLKSKNNLSRDEALEEFIADSMESMFTDGNALGRMEKIKTKHPKLWETLKDFFNKLYLKVKGIYSDLEKSRNYGPETEAGRYVLNMKSSLEKINKLFAESAVKAGENYQALSRGKYDNIIKLSPVGSDVELKPESGNIAYSLRERERLEEKSNKFFANNRKQSQHFDEAELKKANDMINTMAEIMLPYLDITDNNGKRYLPEEILGKTTFQNGSYGKTIENTTICFRTLSYIDFTNEIKKKIGRPLTVEESFLASQMLYDIAKEPQCLYCYVSLDRKAYDGFLLEYTKQRDEVVEKYKNLKNKSKANVDKLYNEFLNGRKPTPQMRNRFDIWINAVNNGDTLITNADLTTEEVRSQIKNEGGTRAAQVADAEKYAQSASWAKKLEQYRSYNSDLLNMSPQMVSKLNKHYGLRFYSFSEYTPAFIVENMQQIRDASLKGLYGLAYTKKTDFARIFANTGMNINISVFGKMQGGEVVADTRQGADWSEVQKLRKQYKNVGAVFVATNDDLVKWALDQEWIDVVIPFHIVRTGANVAEFYKWVNNTKFQNDVDEAGKNKTITPAEHHNDYATFMKLVKERGLTPRFDKWINDPNYMKLVNETRLSDLDSVKLHPEYNLEAAKKSFSQFIEDGGYYGDWYKEGTDYGEAVNRVANDVLEGRRANEVEYGRQDIDITQQKRSSLNRQHGVSGVKLSGRDDDVNIYEAKYEAFPATKFSDRITDKKLIDFLENQEHITTYKAMLLLDGKLYPPMASKVKNEQGKYVMSNPREVGEWMQATEDTANIKEFNKDGVGYYDLKKEDGGTVKAAYNPYEHSSNLVLNDQFEAAYSRPNIVTVKCEIPVSEMTSGYKAEHAKDSVGYLDWHSGVVAGKLKSNKRKVYLSRYLKVVEIMDNAEVAKMYKETLGDQDIAVPFNVVTPGLRTELEKVGVKIDKNGTPGYQSLQKRKKKSLNSVNGTAPIAGDYKNNDLSKDNVTQTSEDVNKSKSDTEYLELAKNPEKNATKLQQMTDEAAKKAGYTERVYHGTVAKKLFNIFRSGSGQYGNGVYFTYDESLAKTYGNVMNLYVKIDKIATYDDAYEAVGVNNYESIDAFAKSMGYDSADEMYNDYANDPTSPVSNPDLIPKLVESGFDGFEDDGNGGFVLWDIPNFEVKIKLADPVTYDDNGNVIPLSKRFDSSNKDIRYSERNEEEVQRLQKVQEVLERQNAKLKEDNAALKELLKLQGVETKGTMFTYGSLKKVASLIMAREGIKGESEGFVKLLGDAYKYLKETEDIDGFNERARKAAEWLADRMKPEATSNEELQDLSNFFKGRTIYISPEMKSEIIYKYGSYRDFLNGLRGKVNFTQDRAKGTPIDVVMQEAADVFPQYFEADMSDKDMPAAIYDTVQMLIEESENLSKQELEYVKPLLIADAVEAISDGFWKLATLRTVADRYADKIVKLKGEHNQRMAKLRNDLKAQVESITKKLKAEKAEAIKAYKAESEAEISDIKKKYAERISNVRAEKNQKMKDIKEMYLERIKASKERREQKAMIEKILKKVKTLNSMLLNEDAKNHVTYSLKKITAEALSAINMTTIKDEERLAKLEKKIKETTDPAVLEQLWKYYDKVVNASERRKVDFDRLTDAYNEIKTSSDPRINAAYDEVISDMLEDVKSRVGTKPLIDMSMEELTEVYDLYKALLKKIKDANKAFRLERFENILEASNAVMNEVKDITKNRTYAEFNGFINGFTWDNLKPEKAFSRIGSGTLTDLWHNVRNGEDTWAQDYQEARDFFMQKAKQYGYFDWDVDKPISIENADGDKIDMTLGELMSLYAYSKRDQALEHMEKGGVVHRKKTRTVKKFFKVTEADTAPYRIDGTAFDNIVKNLNANQKAFIDEMQDYLSSVIGAKGNEVSNLLYDIDLFKEKYYFPLKSASNYLKGSQNDSNDVLNAAKVNPKIKNKGFTKKLTKHANNPIILDNFMDVWAGHVNEMSMYHAFVPALEDLNRVITFVEQGNTGSVRATLEKAYGTHAMSYISTLLNDLNGGTRSDGRADVINRLTSLFKKGAVFASLSVVVQQPSAVARAWAYVNPKYFVQTALESFNMKKHSAEWEECKKYAPIARIKEMGYFDTHMGRGTIEWMTSQEYEGFAEKAKAVFKDAGYRDELLSKLPSLADEITWTHIWNAVKAEVKDTTQLTPGSEEFYKKCAERFNEVIVNTQVYDSVLSRSAYMRSKDSGMKMATAFMAEPTTSINMCADAIMQAKRGTMSKKQASRIIGSVVAQVILNSALVAIVYAARDDDDDKTYIEKYLKSLVEETKSGVNPLTMVPFLKDIVSLFEGYDVDRADMSAISSLIKAWKKLDSDSIDSYTKFETISGAVANMFGIPLKNLLRDARGIYNVVNDIASDKQTTALGVKQAIVEGLTGENAAKQDKSNLLSALEGNDLAEIKKASQEWLELKIKQGKSEKDAKSAIQTAITTEWKPRFQQAYLDKDNEEMARIRKAINAAGIYKDVVKTTQQWIKDIKK